MRVNRLALAAGLAVVAAACQRESVFTNPTPPSAAVRFLNAIPDTGAVDIRFVDQVTEQPVIGLNFRDQYPYQTVAPGNRNLRVFLSTTTQPTIRLFDTTFNFAAGQRYTVILNGQLRQGTGRVDIIQDNVPTTVATGQVATRVLHYAAGVGPVAIDIDANPSATANDTTAIVPVLSAFAAFTPTGGTALSNLPFRGSTGYFTVPALPLVAVTGQPPAGGAQTRYRFRVAATGTTAPVLVDNVAPTGVPGTTAINPLGGFNVAGSGLTAVVVAPSTPGSQAPQVTRAQAQAGGTFGGYSVPANLVGSFNRALQADFTRPAIVFLLNDVRPPNTQQ